MNLLDEVDKIKKDGYSEANAEAKLCQDIIIKAISQSSLNRNVTIKGGVVMRSLSKNARRATQDLDLDFIRFSISEESIGIFIEKLKSLMRFGTRSTRYKDVFDNCYLSDLADVEKLRFCIQKYIYADTTIDVNDADEIRRRAERIFFSSTYKKQVERSKKNWLDLSVDEVRKKDLEFLYRI